MSQPSQLKSVLRIDELLDEVAMRWRSLSLGLERTSITFEGPIAFASSHLNVDFQIDLNEAETGQLTQVAHLWHLAATTGVCIDADMDRFIVRFACGCELTAANAGFPETVKLTNRDSPFELTRWPADMPI